VARPADIIRGAWCRRQHASTRESSDVTRRALDCPSPTTLRLQKARWRDLRAKDEAHGAGGRTPPRANKVSARIINAVACVAAMALIPKVLLSILPPPSWLPSTPTPSAVSTLLHGGRGRGSRVSPPLFDGSAALFPILSGVHMAVVPLGVLCLTVLCWLAQWAASAAVRWQAPLNEERGASGPLTQHQRSYEYEERAPCESEASYGGWDDESPCPRAVTLDRRLRIRWSRKNGQLDQCAWEDGSTCLAQRRSSLGSSCSLDAFG